MGGWGCGGGDGGEGASLRGGGGGERVGGGGGRGDGLWVGLRGLVVGRGCHGVVSRVREAWVGLGWVHRCLDEIPPFFAPCFLAS